ncbi:lysylphosphatidylglycerol synthase transmembrane domain-containing protein [Salinimicrobium sp. TIG7-5_MAKvit]|uniref:lysylphosphatidylglycerol synthase transmembrane domain-containing protein n=1 Tax=Salinimicrobium sp. TIG7-5_MAKvit TaxID=3121289 RepID=UPI003C6DFB18
MKRIGYKAVLKFIFSIGLVVFLFFNLDLSKLYLIKIDVLLPFFVAVMITLIAIGFMSFRWKLLIREFLNSRFAFLSLFNFYLIGAFFNIFLPGSIGGDVVRTQKISRGKDVPLKTATGITVLERLCGIYGLLILISISLFFTTYPAGLEIERFFPVWAFKLSPLLVLICIPLFKWILLKFKFEASYIFILKIIGISLLAQMGDISTAYLLSQYFDLSISFPAFIFMMPLVYVATVLPISIGGLGVREGAFSGLMLLYGVEISIAILISLIMYLVKVSVGLVGYVIYLTSK